MTLITHLQSTLLIYGGNKLNESIENRLKVVFLSTSILYRTRIPPSKNNTKLEMLCIYQIHI